MPYSKIMIRTGTIPEVLKLARSIPEFTDPIMPERLHGRLHDDIPHLIHIAYQGDQAAGFKVGYERDSDGSFYSWLGAVHPDFRRMGIARKLAEAQEVWAKDRGYTHIRFKTRNCFPEMLIFSLSRGFYLTGIEPYPDQQQSRIWLEKVLG